MVTAAAVPSSIPPLHSCRVPFEAEADAVWFAVSVNSDVETEAGFVKLEVVLAEAEVMLLHPLGVEAGRDVYAYPVARICQHTQTDWNR